MHQPRNILKQIGIEFIWELNIYGVFFKCPLNKEDSWMYSQNFVNRVSYQGHAMSFICLLAVALAVRGKEKRPAPVVSACPPRHRSDLACRR